jgi:hypothetical protein
MFRPSLATLLAIPLCVALAHGMNETERPTWAKQAVVIDRRCTSTAQQIKSPDRGSSIEILCHPGKQSDPTYTMRVLVSDGRSYSVPLDNGAHEILWSPNSKAFLINGGSSAYAGFFVTVYHFEQSAGIRKSIITERAQRDMVVHFPPCKVQNRDAQACHKIAANPQYNMSGIAWADNSSAVDVFAEIPCSSSYGGIMCQVLGYELRVPDGRILQRLTASQVKHSWQPQMGWDMKIPDPVIYGSPHPNHSPKTTWK